MNGWLASSNKLWYSFLFPNKLSIISNSPRVLIQNLYFQIATESTNFQLFKKHV